MIDDNKDKLLESFFAGNRHEIADNGFTHRVMSRLPRRHHRLAQVWDIACTVLIAAMFVALGGAQRIWGNLCDLFTTLVEQGLDAQTDLRSLLIAGGVLLFLAYRKIASLA